MASKIPDYFKKHIQMREIILAVLLILGFQSVSAQQKEFKVITVVESIVPGGLGRSRLIENNEELEIDFVKHN